MAKSLTFIFTLLCGALVGILASPHATNRPACAFVGLILSIPVAICALYIWQGADRFEDDRWAAREKRKAERERPL